MPNLLTAISDLLLTLRLHLRDDILPKIIGRRQHLMEWSFFAKLLFVLVHAVVHGSAVDSAIIDILDLAWGLVEGDVLGSHTSIQVRSIVNIDIRIIILIDHRVMIRMDDSRQTLALLTAWLLRDRIK